MAQPAAVRQTGAETIFWDLSSLYTSREDPHIEADLQHTQQLADSFAQTYRGKLGSLDAEEWRQAFDDLAVISDLRAKSYTYASLNFTVYSSDASWGAFIQKMQEMQSQISQSLVFFDLEWNNLPGNACYMLVVWP